MAVSSLRYRPNAPPPEESSLGYVIFSGSPFEFHHWEYRTTLKKEAAREADMAQVAASIVENLRGTVAQVAMEIPMAEMLARDGSGIMRLIDSVREHIFPIVQQEAKELYKEGHRTRDGVLTRQNNEPMQNYILDGGIFYSGWTRPYNSRPHISVICCWMPRTSQTCRGS